MTVTITVALHPGCPIGVQASKRDQNGGNWRDYLAFCHDGPSRNGISPKIVASVIAGLNGQIRYAAAFHGQRPYPIGNNGSGSHKSQKFLVSGPTSSQTVV
jgi:hypothetical protein